MKALLATLAAELRARADAALTEADTAVKSAPADELGDTPEVLARKAFDRAGASARLDFAAQCAAALYDQARALDAEAARRP